MWQEGREEEGRLVSATVKQRKTRVVECYLESEKGYLTPEVRAANEMICDYVWEKMLPSHFCNLL
jgi:hypothetical protein